MEYGNRRHVQIIASDRFRREAPKLPDRLKFRFQGIRKSFGCGVTWKATIFVQCDCSSPGREHASAWFAVSPGKECEEPLEMSIADG
jgi:hypothetical protein